MRKLMILLMGLFALFLLINAYAGSRTTTRPPIEDLRGDAVR